MCGIELKQTMSVNINVKFQWRASATAVRALHVLEFQMTSQTCLRGPCCVCQEVNSLWPWTCWRSPSLGHSITDLINGEWLQRIACDSSLRPHLQCKCYRSNDTLNSLYQYLVIQGLWALIKKKKCHLLIGVTVTQGPGEALVPVLCLASSRQNSSLKRGGWRWVVVEGAAQVGSFMKEDWLYSRQGAHPGQKKKVPYHSIIFKTTGYHNCFLNNSINPKRTQPLLGQ